MGATYERGTVAMVTALNRREEYRACFTGKTWTELAGAFSVDEPTSIRPLVILDDVDAIDAHILLEGLRRWSEWTSLTSEKRLLGNLIDQIEAQTKPPRPAEPTGLAAVVEDEAGNNWVRMGGGPAPWMLAHASPDNRDTVPYSTIQTVRVLAEGVES